MTEQGALAIVASAGKQKGLSRGMGGKEACKAPCSKKPLASSCGGLLVGPLDSWVASSCWAAASTLALVSLGSGGRTSSKPSIPSNFLQYQSNPSQAAMLEPEQQSKVFTSCMAHCCDEAPTQAYISLVPRESLRVPEDQVKHRTATSKWDNRTEYCNGRVESLTPYLTRREALAKAHGQPGPIGQCLATGEAWCQAAHPYVEVLGPVVPVVLHLEQTPNNIAICRITVKN